MDTSSQVRHLDCAVHSQTDTIDIAVFNYGHREVSKLIWLAHSPQRCVSIQSIGDLLRHRMRHWGVEDPWCDRCHPNTKFSEVSRHWHNHTIDGSLCGTICNLASLTLRCCHTRYEYYYTFFASIINSLIL